MRRFPAHPFASPLRRVLLLLAFVASLTAPAFTASTVMARAIEAMPPCHEAVSAAASPHAGHMPKLEAAHAANPAGMHAQPLCCATACVVALPPQAVLFAPLGRLRPLWEEARHGSLHGRAPPIPVPPPRAFS